MSARAEVAKTDLEADFLSLRNWSFGNVIPDNSNTATLSPGILKCFQLTFACFCIFKIFVNIFPVVSLFNNSVSYFYFAQFMEKELNFHLNSSKHLCWWTHVEHVFNETFFCLPRSLLDVFARRLLERHVFLQTPLEDVFKIVLKPPLEDVLETRL